MSTNPHLSASEAAQRLGVTPATLYAYVSRGLIRAEKSHGRQNRYLAEDVERLVQRKGLRQNPTKAAEQALDWGTPVLDSSLTLIEGGQFYYRGHNALGLSTRLTLEETAALLWGLAEFPTAKGLPKPRVPESLGILAALQCALPQAAAQDLGAYDLRPEAVARSGSRILRLFLRIVSGSASAQPAAQVLAQSWSKSPKAPALLSQALVLCADHELNVSAFTVRCVASAGASLYAAINAGLSALQGSKHGGAVEKTQAFLQQTRAGNLEQAIAIRLQQEGSVPGFGHRLYPAGDPRAQALLQSLEANWPSNKSLRRAKELAQAVQEHLGDKPNLDFALAVLTQVLDLPQQAGLALFALGRSVGWVAHAIESYNQNRLIRPRARYTGPLPT